MIYVIIDILYPDLFLYTRNFNYERSNRFLSAYYLLNLCSRFNLQRLLCQSGKLGIQLFNKTINGIFPNGFTSEGNMGLLDFVTNVQ